MGIQFSLGVIRALNLHAVPVSVKDGSAIFHYEGKLTGEFDGLKNDTVIQWQQISGIPVTFTSPLDGEEITFTSNDLDRKVFVCCTNPGTDAELCTSAEFYHFPVDWIDVPHILKNISPNTIHNPDYPEITHFSINVFQGMLPVDISLEGYQDVNRFLGDLVDLDGPINDYSELVTGIDTTAEGRKSIVRTIILKNTGVWEIESQHDGVGTIIGLTEIPEPRRMVYHFLRYGYEYYITIDVPARLSGGWTSSQPVNEDYGNPTVSLNTALSKIVNYSEEDTIDVLGKNGASTLALTTLLQTIVNEEFSDSVSLPNEDSVNTIILTTALQTSVGVT